MNDAERNIAVPTGQPIAVDRDSGPDGWLRTYPTDSRSRRLKAQKILAVLRTRVDLEGARLLEIGVGSGHMTGLFVEAVGPDGVVSGVDVEDLRRVDAGTPFRLVDGAELPFASGSFDVVVSNHVIEHVGGLEEQGRHLRAIRSVLKPDGVAYLGMPSRWSLIESHFRLPLVSWLPRRVRTPYVRIARRGRVYDVEPRAPREFDMLAAGAGLDVTDLTVVGLRLLAQIEPEHWAAPIVRRLPVTFDWLIGPMLPVQIRILTPVAE